MIKKVKDYFQSIKKIEETMWTCPNCIKEFEKTYDGLCWSCRWDSIEGKQGINPRANHLLISRRGGYRDRVSIRNYVIIIEEH